MAVDIKKLLDIVQKRINNLDSSTVTLQELIDIANFTDKASNGTIQFVDDSSDLPNLENPDLPTAEGNHSLTYVKNSGRLFAKKEKWKPFTFRGLIPSSGSSFAFGGTVAGYVASTEPNGSQNITTYSFASDGNGTDAGDMTQGKENSAGASSSTHGYIAGGNTGGTPVNVIEKFSFPTNANATDVGDLTAAVDDVVSSFNDTHGYISGGSSSNVIEKFPFSSDGNASDVGDLTQPGGERVGNSSLTNGYTSGGGQSGYLDKFSFASDGNASDAGNMSVARSSSGGVSSSTDGYSCFGSIPGPPNGTNNTIDKFPFSSETGSAVTIPGIPGPAGTRWRMGSSTSSTTFGYLAGQPVFDGAAVGKEINKFPFSSETTFTDVGDIHPSSLGPSGQVEKGAQNIHF